MINYVFILTFLPIYVFLIQRNTSSAQKHSVKRKVSDDSIKVKSLFCTRAAICNFPYWSTREEPFLRPHYSCSEYVWSWW